MFAVGVIAAGLLSYGAMSQTLEEAHNQRLLAGTNVGLQALNGVGDRVNVYAEIVARHPDLISTVHFPVRAERAHQLTALLAIREQADFLECYPLRTPAP